MVDVPGGCIRIPAVVAAHGIFQEHLAQVDMATCATFGQFALHDEAKLRILAQVDDTLTDFDIAHVAAGNNVRE